MQAVPQYEQVTGAERQPAYECHWSVGPEDRLVGHGRGTNMKAAKQAACVDLLTVSNGDAISVCAECCMLSFYCCNGRLIKLEVKRRSIILRTNLLLHDRSSYRECDRSVCRKFSKRWCGLTASQGADSFYRIRAFAFALVFLLRVHAFCVYCGVLCVPVSTFKTVYAEPSLPFISCAHACTRVKTHIHI